MGDRGGPGGVGEGAEEGGEEVEVAGVDHRAVHLRETEQQLMERGREERTYLEELGATVVVARDGFFEDGGEGIAAGGAVSLGREGCLATFCRHKVVLRRIGDGDVLEVREGTEAHLVGGKLLWAACTRSVPGRTQRARETTHSSAPIESENHGVP